MSKFVKKPCEHCPFRKDVKPFLTAERGAGLAFSAQNRYASFICHKKMKRIGETDEGERIIDQSVSPECAGFLSLMSSEVGRTPYDKDGFEPSDLAYESSIEMALAYRDANKPN